MIYTLLTTRPATINISISWTILFIFVANDNTNKISTVSNFELGNAIFGK